MLKVTIQEEDGSKNFFCDGVQFKNYELKKDGHMIHRSFITVINNDAKVKSCEMMLLSGDLVFVEEIPDD